ncbi:MAG: hypothetical protein M3065_09940 [Actinomycetota bacterium]|nr:hypothetical protein [Actinomycetota bacterium]
MGRRIGMGVVLAWLVLSATASALGGSALVDGDPSLPSSCQDSFTLDIALLCEQTGKLTAPSLTLDGLNETLHGTMFPLGGPQVSMENDPVPITGRYIEAAQPLLPGERLVTRWRTAGAGAVLAARVADPLRAERGVAFAVDPAAGSATLTVEGGGTVQFKSGTLSQTITDPPLAVGDTGGPAAPWDAPSPQAAVQTFINHLGLSSPADLAWLCAGIEPGLRPAFGDFGALGGPDTLAALGDLTGPRDAGESCQLLDLALFGDENVPTVLGSTGTAGAVRMLSPTRAVVQATLTERFEASGSDPGPKGGTITVPAAALVTRAADGIWYLATPQTLFPLNNDSGGQPAPTDAQLSAIHSHLLATARSQLANVRRELDASRAAAVRVRRHPTCVGSRRSTVSDPAGDILVPTDNGENPKARDGSRATIDIRHATLAIGHGRICLALRFQRTAPPTAQIELQLMQAHPIVVATLNLDLGPTSAVGDNDPYTYKPIHGLIANRSGRSVSFSAPLTAVTHVEPGRAFTWDLTIIGPAPYATAFEDTVPNGQHFPPTARN